MRYRKFGKTDWQVSEVGYGMWGLSEWKGSSEEEYNKALDAGVDLGCNFFDTAWGYRSGLSEQVLGRLLKRQAGKKLYVATKVPPKNFKWPAKKECKLEEVFPYDHIIEYTEKSLINLKVDRIDLQQFHVWDDGWAAHDDWKKAIEKLKKDGKVKEFGISVNRWEPANCLNALQTGLFSSVQVIYNIFDQSPIDELFPLCDKLGIGVIARVPFDEGSLTGKMTPDMKFPEGDWRNSYFVPENLIPTLERVEKLKTLVPPGMEMAEMALKFILENKSVSTIIPGMRSIRNVHANMNCSSSDGLKKELLQKLYDHRWDRTPTEWSQ